MTVETYLPPGLAIPVPSPDGLTDPYWQGTREGVLRVQRCRSCGGWQWGPEWICHRCHSFDLAWVPIEGEGRIYSWERPFHPVHPALQGHGPYIIVLVDLPGAGGIRMVGNLLGDPMQEVSIGTPVDAVFEPHDGAQPPFTLVHWRVTTQERKTS